MNNINFQFDKENHFYTLNGKRLYGITTVLGVIAKPALIQWAANEACDYIKEHLLNNGNAVDDRGRITCLPENLKSILEQARTAHRKKKTDAGTKGTDVHLLVESYVKECIEAGGEAKLVITENQSLLNFVNWAMMNKVKFIHSEKQLYSETMWIGGTADLVLEIDGKKYVGDVKTSSAIYPEHFYQMAAYRMMLEEMGETGFSGSVVIRIGKDGKFSQDKDVKYRFDYETDKAAFLGALAIFKAGETYK